MLAWKQLRRSDCTVPVTMYAHFVAKMLPRWAYLRQTSTGQISTSGVWHLYRYFIFFIISPLASGMSVRPFVLPCIKYSALPHRSVRFSLLWPWNRRRISCWYGLEISQFCYAFLFSKSICEHRQQTEVLPMMKSVEEKFKKWLVLKIVVFSCASRNVDVVSSVPFRA
jgi:hypothetical protein